MGMWTEITGAATAAATIIPIPTADAAANTTMTTSILVRRVALGGKYHLQRFVVCA